MFTSAQYLTGWLVYIGACLGLLFVWWRMTRRIPFAPVRDFLLVAAAVAMFVPFQVEPGSGYLAPAFIMATIEGLFVPEGRFARAGTPLIVGEIFFLALFFAGQWGWKKYWRKYDQQHQKEAEQMQDYDELREASDNAVDARSA